MNVSNPYGNATPVTTYKLKFYQNIFKPNDQVNLLENGKPREIKKP